VRTAARRRRRKTLYYPSTIVDIHEESGTYLTPASAIEERTRLDQDEGLVAAPSTHRDQDSATSARRQEIALPWT
jgi:hypothetical protein